MSDLGTLVLDEYVVEKILDRRLVNGVIEYFVKWTAYGDEDNTWECGENLGCKELIHEFDEKRLKPGQNPTSNDPRILKRPVKVGSTVILPSSSSPNGFDRGLKSEKIFGATNINGELEFLIKWSDLDLCDVIPARIANEACPQVAIKFYEERLNWHVEEDDENTPAGNRWICIR